MSTQKSTTKSTDEAPKTPTSQGLTLEFPVVLTSLKGNKVDKNRVLNNIGKTNKKINQKKKKVKKVRGATGGAKNVKKKRRKKVTKSNLDILPNKRRDVVANESKENFKTPRQGNNSSDLANFGHPKEAFFNKDKLQENTWNGQVEPQKEIQQKQDVFPVELDEILLKFEHYALLVEEYFLVLDSLKR
tara:strand:+ start:631 stop:1194 length:564 start_codon:yes stop_codon:yes gene_type:complete